MLIIWIPGVEILKVTLSEVEKYSIFPNISYIYTSYIYLGIN